MDFSDTPEEAGFRAEARAFLQKTAEPRGGMFETWESRYGEAEALRRAKDFQRRKAEAGLAGITWPKEYGGRGGTPIQHVIYALEESRYLVPRGYFEIGRASCRERV